VAESQSAPVNHAASTMVSDCSVQVQLESWNDEELQQLREEVRMLRIKCQRTSGLMLCFLCSNASRVQKKPLFFLK